MCIQEEIVRSRRQFLHMVADVEDIVIVVPGRDLYNLLCTGVVELLKPMYRNCCE